MQKQSTLNVLLPIVAGIVLSLGVPRHTAALAEPKPPFFEKISLKPFVIEKQPVEGALARTDESKILETLSQKATQQATRFLKNKRIARIIETPVAEKNANEVLVTGNIRLPISLPPHVIGFDAAVRRGVFAKGKVVFHKADGSVIAEEEVKLSWGDGWWLNGARHRHNAPLDDVLSGFVRKITERALQRIARKLHSNQTTKPEKQKKKSDAPIFSTLENNICDE